MNRSCLFGLLAAGVALGGVQQAIAEPTCKPALAFKKVRFSAMQPPTMERKWTAALSVDASQCATTSGRFEIGFTRSKEHAIEVDFQEQFVWKPGSIEVSVDFAADEAVERYWLGSIPACPCRD